MLLGGGRSGVSGGNQTAASTAAGSGSSTAKVVFNSDGTTTNSFTGLNGNGSAVHSWFLGAPLAGIGASYWISFNGGAWTSLSSGANSPSLTGTNSSTSFPYSIASDSGGSNVVGSGTIFLNVSNGL
jgi:hypothetical protein